MLNLKKEEFKSNFYSSMYKGKSGIQIESFTSFSKKIEGALNNSCFSFNRERFESSFFCGFIPFIEKSGLNFFKERKIATRPVDKAFFNVLGCIWLRLKTTPTFIKQRAPLSMVPSHIIPILDNLKTIYFPKNLSRKEKLLETALKSPTIKALYERANKTPSYNKQSESDVWTIEFVPPAYSLFDSECLLDKRQIKLNSKICDSAALSSFVFELINGINTPKFKELDKKTLSHSMTCNDYAKEVERIEFNTAVHHACVMKAMIKEVWGDENKLSSKDLKELNCFEGSLRYVKESDFYMVDNKKALDQAFEKHWAIHLNSGAHPHTQVYIKECISCKESLENKGR